MHFSKSLQGIKLAITLRPVSLESTLLLFLLIQKFLECSLNSLANPLQFATVLSPVCRAIFSLRRGQKRFDSILKLFVSHYSISSNFGKVVLFRLLVKIFIDILLLLKCQNVFTRRSFYISIHFVYLFIIVLLSSFVTEGASLSLTIFSLLKHVYQQPF